MRTFEVRNRLTGMVIAEVAVDRPEQVLSRVVEETGSAVEDVAAALGKTMAEIREALEIIETVAEQPLKRRLTNVDPFPNLPKPTLIRSM